MSILKKEEQNQDQNGERCVGLLNKGIKTL